MGSSADQQVHVDLKHAAAGGVVTFLIMGAVVSIVGGLSAGEAQILLESTLPTTRFLCSGVMTVSATTLALMLTLLSLSAGMDRDIKPDHYQRIRQIALLDVAVFTIATILLVALVVPFGESTSLSTTTYAVIYYVVTLLSALMGGALVTMILMLYQAVTGLISIFRAGDESPLVQAHDKEE